MGFDRARRWATRRASRRGSLPTGRPNTEREAAGQVGRRGYPTGGSPARNCSGCRGRRWGVLDVLDAAASAGWARSALAALGQAREPRSTPSTSIRCPDGDTGTNLYLTVEAGLLARSTAAVADDRSSRAGARGVRAGALLGARGNSGMILAQLLRGWRTCSRSTGRGTALAAEQAMRLADAGPRCRGCARSRAPSCRSPRRGRGPRRPVPGDGLPAVVAAAVGAAREALARTPGADARAAPAPASWTPAARLSSSCSRRLRGLVAGRRATVPAAGGRRPSPVVDLTHCDDLDADGPAYEVMYLLRRRRTASGRCARRSPRSATPSSSSAGSGLWNVHVHVDDAGAAVERALDVGRPRRIRVAHFARADRAAQRPAADGGRASWRAPPARAWPRCFEESGAVVVRTAPRPASLHRGDPGRRAAHRGADVVVLPNDGDTVAVARAAAGAARDEGIRVAVAADPGPGAGAGRAARCTIPRHAATPTSSR